MTTFQAIGVTIAEALKLNNYEPEIVAAWYAAGVADTETIIKVGSKVKPDDWAVYESYGFTEQETLDLIAAGIGPKNVADVRTLLKRPEMTAAELIANKESGVPAATMRELLRIGWSGQPVGKGWTASGLTEFRKQGGTIADLYDQAGEPVKSIPDMPQVRFQAKMTKRGLPAWNYRQFGPDSYGWGYEITEEELDRFVPFATAGYENLGLVRDMTDEQIAGLRSWLKGSTSPGQSVDLLNRVIDRIASSENRLTDEQEERLRTICFDVAAATGEWPSLFLRVVAGALTREAPKQDIAPVGFGDAVSYDRAYQYTTCLPDRFTRTHRQDVYVQNETFRHVWSCWVFHNNPDVRSISRSGAKFIATFDWLADTMSHLLFPDVWWANWETLCESNNTFNAETVFVVSAWGRSRHRGARYTWPEVQAWSTHGLAIESGLWLRTQFPDVPLKEAADQFRAFYKTRRDEVEF